MVVGMWDFEEVVQAAGDRWSEELDDGTLETIADEEFAAHLAAQETWAEVTDGDRLTRAFRDLDVAGVVAREHFSCCRSCGVAEIGAEGKGRGYTFYHWQDAQTAARGAGLYLAYGPGADGTATAGEIGRLVVEALRGNGLDAEWDGDPGTRVLVPLIWRRRRLGRMAWHPGQAAPASPYPLLVTAAGETERRLSGAAACDLLMRTAPRDGEFVSCEDDSGLVVQMMWEDGPRLWAESPDPAARCGRGRYVSLEEARLAITTLAAEGRNVLPELGELTEVTW